MKIHAIRLLLVVPLAASVLASGASAPSAAGGTQALAAGPVAVRSEVASRALPRAPLMVVPGMIDATTISPRSSNGSGDRRHTIVITDERYGPKSYQIARVYQPVDVTVPNRTVYLFHGGGWVKGDRTSSESHARDWATRGWTVVNAEYQLGAAGALVIEDLEKLLATFENDPRVDRSRQIATGGSAGGHLALLLAGLVAPGHFKAVVAWSPPMSPRLAQVDGRRRGATSQQRSLAHNAEQVWGRQWARASALTHVRKLPPLWIAGSTGEFVVWAHQGQQLAAKVPGSSVIRVAGTLHVPRSAALARRAEAWALARVSG